MGLRQNSGVSGAFAEAYQLIFRGKLSNLRSCKHWRKARKTWGIAAFSAHSLHDMALLHLS
jgi:hypothetical protein